MNRITYPLIALALGTVLATGALACTQTSSTTGPLVRRSAFLSRALGRADVQEPAATSVQGPVTIVGLWEAESFADGMQVDDAFDVFYADGSELLNDASPILLGNVCVGQWTQTGTRTYSLHHVSWNFDDQGNPNGRSTSDLNITVDPSGKTYSATGIGVGYDLMGNELGSGSFTVKAQRISAPSAGTFQSAVTKAVAKPKDATVLLRQITLDGSASTSADGKPLNYYWTLASGSLPAAITQSTTANPVVQFGGFRGQYIFILTVADSNGNVDTDRVTVDFEGI